MTIFKRTLAAILALVTLAALGGCVQKEGGGAGRDTAGAGAAGAGAAAGAAGAAGKVATPYGDLPPDLAHRLEVMEQFKRMSPEEQQAYMLKAQEEAMAAAQKYGITADGKVAGPTGGKVTCPWCGAQTTPDAAGNCEFCGGSVKG